MQNTRGESTVESLPAVPISRYLSLKLRVITLISVCAVVVVHAYNLNSRFLAGENGPEAPGVPGLVGFIEYLCSQALTRWPAALLFAISGFLFFRNLDFVVAQYVAKYRSRLRSLVVPYLLWSAWGLLVFAVVHRFALGGGLVTSGSGRLSPPGALRLLFVDPVAYPLWFLQALILCVAAPPLLYLLVRGLRLAAPLVFVPAWLLDLEYTNYINFKALTFFTLGAVVAVTLRRGWAAPWAPLTRGADPEGARPAPGAVALGRYLLPVFVGSAIVFSALLRDSEATWAALLHKGLMVLAVAAMWFGYDAYLRGLARRPRVLWLTGFSFFLFVAQEPVLMIVKRGLLRVLGSSDAAVLAAYFLTMAITVAVCLAAGWALRAVASPFYAVLTGRRSKAPAPAG